MSLRDYSELDILWERPLSASIISTPVINDWDGFVPSLQPPSSSSSTTTKLFHRDGIKEIIVTTHDSVDIITANTATSVKGWPFGFSHATFAADPILYDVDSNGNDEIIVASLNGEIAFLKYAGPASTDSTF